MRHLLAAISALGLLGAVIGCHHTAGICDCDTNTYGCDCSCFPMTNPWVIKPAEPKQAEPIQLPKDGIKPMPTPPKVEPPEAIPTPPTEGGPDF